MRIASSLAIPFLVGIALADIAPEPMAGSSLGVPRESTTIRMAEEEVEIRLASDRAVVSARFVLVNEGEPAEIEVGFPDSGPPRGADPGVPILRDLVAEVAGSSVETRYADSPEISDYRGWILFRAAFPAGETTIRVSYWVLPMAEYDPGVLGNRQVGYVLRTGAAWKGSIGRVRVRLTLDAGMVPAQIRRLGPEPASMSNEGWVWDWSDLEPSEDIRIEFSATTAAEKLSQLRRRLSEVPPENERGLELVWCDIEECSRLGQDHAATIEACDWFLERERRLGWPIAPSSIERKFRKWLPWELAKARALAALGRQGEARVAAGLAVVRLEEVVRDWVEMDRTNDAGPVQRKYKIHDTSVDWEGAKQGLAEMKSLAGIE